MIYWYFIPKRNVIFVHKRCEAWLKQPSNAVPDRPAVMLHQSQLGLSKVEVVCICSAGSELQGNKHFLDLLERLKLRKTHGQCTKSALLEKIWRVYLASTTQPQPTVAPAITILLVAVFTPFKSCICQQRFSKDVVQVFQGCLLISPGIPTLLQGPGVNQKIALKYPCIVFRPEQKPQQLNPTAVTHLQCPITIGIFHHLFTFSLIILIGLSLFTLIQTHNEICQTNIEQFKQLQHLHTNAPVLPVF